MHHQLYLATAHGLVLCVHDGTQWQVIGWHLEGKRITTVIARQGVVLVGTEDGVLCTDNEGKRWRESGRGLSTPYIRWLAYHPADSNHVFAGTEPAGIFVSRDGGSSWHECPEVAQIRDSHQWFLPYSPGAGCIRDFAFVGRRAYAAVEVGGALRSDDGGASWRLCAGSDGNPSLAGPPPPLIYPDVHSIVAHPSSPDLVFAPTGGGFYSSTDGGATWTLHYDCYCRAVWVDPADPAHLILGPADNVASGGRIEETHVGGRTWSPASYGLAVPWRNHMVERFEQVGDDLLAVLSNGQLLGASLASLEWKRIVEEVPGVNAVAMMAYGQVNTSPQL